MTVKTSEQSSGVIESDGAGQDVSGEMLEAAQTAKGIADSEQLSRQAGRILEQLLALDEQYHEFIIAQDQSALEALSACTIVLSKLAHPVRRVNHLAHHQPCGSDRETHASGSDRSSDRRRAG